MLNSTPAFTYKLPTGQVLEAATSWQDLTLGAYGRLLAIDASIDTYGFLATCLGTTREVIMNLPTQVGSDAVASLGYLQLPVPQFPLPEYVHLPGPKPGEVVAVAVPRELEGCTFGQATDLGTLLQEHTDSPGLLRLYALAIFLMPGYTQEPYDSDFIPAMLEVVRKAKLGEGLPTADFFIWNMSGLPLGTVGGSSPSNIVGKSWRLGTEILVRTGKRMPWLTPWLTVTR